MPEYGPQTEFAQQLHAEKYRDEGETFDDYCVRYARSTTDNQDSFYELLDALREQRILPGGRQQRAVGAPNGTTASNCYVGPTIPDSMSGIMDVLKEGALTLKSGGGIGWDFSTLRPAGDRVKGGGRGAVSSGPVSFMTMFNAMCGTIMAGGSRRGAMMAVLRVDHPDIIRFIRAKRDNTSLTNFNISVAIPDEFMKALEDDSNFNLKFQGKAYETVRAKDLWAVIMENNWEYAEPGVLFIDRINQRNNLWYCEQICSTNPCLPVGTLVDTPIGAIPVEHLNVGDYINTVDGTPRPITKISSYDNVPTMNVQLSGGVEIEATPGHIFHSKPGSRRAKKWNTSTPLSELEEGDLIRLAPSLFTNCPEPFPGDLDKSYKYGLLTGALLGDGSFNGPGTTRMCFGKGEPRWMNFIKDLVVSMGASGITGERETTFQITLPIEFSRWVVDNLHLDSEKNIDQRLFLNQGVEFRKGLIDGLVSTDGNINLSGSSPQVRLFGKKEITNLAVGVLSSLGIKSRSYLSASAGQERSFSGRPTALTRNCMVLVVSGASAVALSKLLVLSNPHKEVKLEQVRKMNKRWISPDWLKIISVTPGSSRTVYDIYEKETDTWLTGGIVNRGCGEKPLPPEGTCLLGSINLVKYLSMTEEGFSFNFEKYKNDIYTAIAAFDKVIDIARYPIEAQEVEALAKRRIGLGLTGVANTIEAFGHKYGSDLYLEWHDLFFALLRDYSYMASIELAKQYGSFPAFRKEEYLAGPNIQDLPQSIRDDIAKYGIRNSELTSIAPTGTISLCADNVSSGIEPVFSLETKRNVIMEDGVRVVTVKDWGLENLGVVGTTADKVRPEDHIRVLCHAQKYIDSAVSKTCNVKGEVHGKKVDGDEISFSEFKDLYLQAWHGGAKGCTTFNINGKRTALLTSGTAESKVHSSSPNGENRNSQGYSSEKNEGAACYMDPSTGIKTCDE